MGTTSEELAAEVMGVACILSLMQDAVAGGSGDDRMELALGVLSGVLERACAGIDEGGVS